MKKVFRGTLLSRFLAISVLMIFLLSNIVSASLLDLVRNKADNLITGAAEGETAPAESSPAPSSDSGGGSSDSGGSAPSSDSGGGSSDSGGSAPTEEHKDDSTQPPSTPPSSDQQCPQVSCNCPNGCEIRNGCLTSSCLQIDQDLIREHEDDFREIDNQRKKDDFEKRKKEEYEKYQKRLEKERGGDRRDDRRDNRGDGRGEYDEHRGPSAEDMKRMQQENDKRRQEDQERMKEDQSMRSEQMQQWLEDIEFKLEDIESQGVDVSEGNRYIEDARNLLRKASSANNPKEADKLFRDAEKALRGFQKLEMKLRQESDKIRMLEEVENVLYEVENFMGFIEDDIADAKEFGADTTEADKLMNEVKDAISSLQKMKDSKDFDRKTFMKNMNFIRRSQPKFEKVMRELRAVGEVKRIIEEIEMRMEDGEPMLQEFKDAGIDTSEADKLMQEVKNNLQKIIELYKAGKAQQAFTILRKMQPIGNKMERLMRDYFRQMDKMGRRGDFGKEQIEDILDEAFTRIPLAKGKIKEFSDDGIDTSDAEEILGKIKGIMFKAKELYKEGNNQDAMDVAKQAFPYANKLEKLLSGYRKKNFGIEDFGKLELVQSVNTKEPALAPVDDELAEESSLLETSKVRALKNTVQKIRSEVKSLINAADTNIPGAESKLAEFKASGVDVARAEGLLSQIRALVATAKDKFEGNDFIAALETLEKAYPLADKLESEFGKLGKKHTKDYLKAEIEAILLKAKDKLPGVRESLKEYKSESMDTSKADELVSAIEKLIEDAEDKFNAGEYKAALDILQRAFPLGAQVEREFDRYNKERKDESKIKAQLDEMYKEADSNLPIVEKTVSDLAAKGSDTEKAKRLLADLRKIIATSQSLYQSKKYKEALLVVKKAESSEVELSQLINTYFAELESGKKEKVGKEDQTQDDKSFLEKIGIRKESKDKYDQFDDDFSKFEDEVDINLPNDKNRFEDEPQDEFRDNRDDGRDNMDRGFGGNEDFRDGFDGGRFDEGMPDDRMGRDDKGFREPREQKMQPRNRVDPGFPGVNIVERDMPQNDMGNRDVRRDFADEERDFEQRDMREFDNRQIQGNRDPEDMGQERIQKVEQMREPQDRRDGQGFENSGAPMAVPR